MSNSATPAFAPSSPASVEPRISTYSPPKAKAAVRRPVVPNKKPSTCPLCGSALTPEKYLEIVGVWQERKRLEGSLVPFTNDKGRSHQQPQVHSLRGTEFRAQTLA
jgi:hypothetical protein